MTTQELIKDAIGKAFNTLKKKSAIYSNGKEIPANANLNSYMTEGVYYSPNGTRTATLTNAPVSNAGFKLIVMKAGYVGTNNLMQIAICPNYSMNGAFTNAVYLRRYYDTWRVWVKAYLADMDSLLSYTTTYADLYDRLTRLPTGQPAVFHMATAVANAISNNRIAGTFRGVVSRTSSDSFDFIGMSEAGGSIWTIRATLATSGATVSNIQRMVMPSTSSPLIKRVTYHYDYTVAANANLNITGDNLGISTPSGYAVLAPYGFTTGNSSVVTRSLSAGQSGSTTVYALRNVSSSQQTGTAYLSIAYIRYEALNG